MAEKIVLEIKFEDDGSVRLLGETGKQLVNIGKTAEDAERRLDKAEKALKSAGQRGREASDALKLTQQSFKAMQNPLAAMQQSLNKLDTQGFARLKGGLRDVRTALDMGKLAFQDLDKELQALQRHVPNLNAKLDQLQTSLGTQLGKAAAATKREIKELLAEMGVASRTRINNALNDSLKKNFGGMAEELTKGINEAKGETEKLAKSVDKVGNRGKDVKAVFELIEDSVRDAELRVDKFEKNVKDSVLSATQLSNAFDDMEAGIDLAIQEIVRMRSEMLEAGVAMGGVDRFVDKVTKGLKDGVTEAKRLAQESKEAATAANNATARAGGVSSGGAGTRTDVDNRKIKETAAETRKAAKEAEIATGSFNRLARAIGNAAGKGAGFGSVMRSISRVPERLTRTMWRLNNAFFLVRQGFQGLQAAATFFTSGFGEQEEFQELSKKLQLQAKDIKELKVAADLTGVSMADIGVAVKQFNRTLDRANVGGVNAWTEALKKLEFTTEQVRGKMLTAQDVIDRVGVKMKDFGKDPAFIELLTRIGGRGAFKVLPALEVKGREEFSELLAVTERLGQGFGKTAQEAQDLADTAEQIKFSWKLVSGTLDGAVKQLNIGMGNGLVLALERIKLLVSSLGLATTVVRDFGKELGVMINVGLAKLINRFEDFKEAAEKDFIGAFANLAHDAGRKLGEVLPRILSIAIPAMAKIGTQFGLGFLDGLRDAMTENKIGAIFTGAIGGIFLGESLSRRGLFSGKGKKKRGAGEGDDEAEGEKDISDGVIKSVLLATTIGRSAIVSKFIPGIISAISGSGLAAAITGVLANPLGAGIVGALAVGGGIAIAATELGASAADIGKKIGSGLAKGIAESIRFVLVDLDSVLKNIFIRTFSALEDVLVGVWEVMTGVTEGLMEGMVGALTAFAGEALSILGDLSTKLGQQVGSTFFEALGDSLGVSGQWWSELLIDGPEEAYEEARNRLNAFVDELTILQQKRKFAQDQPFLNMFLGQNIEEIDKDIADLITKINGSLDEDRLAKKLVDFDGNEIDARREIRGEDEIRDLEHAQIKRNIELQERKQEAIREVARLEAKVTEENDNGNKIRKEAAQAELQLAKGTVAIERERLEISKLQTDIAILSEQRDLPSNRDNDIAQLRLTEEINTKLNQKAALIIGLSELENKQKANDRSGFNQLIEEGKARAKIIEQQAAAFDKLNEKSAMAAAKILAMNTAAGSGGMLDAFLESEAAALGLETNIDAGLLKLKLLVIEAAKLSDQLRNMVVASNNQVIGETAAVEALEQARIDGLSKEEAQAKAAGAKKIAIAEAKTMETVNALRNQSNQLRTIGLGLAGEEKAANEAEIKTNDTLADQLEKDFENKKKGLEKDGEALAAVAKRKAAVMDYYRESNKGANQELTAAEKFIEKTEQAIATLVSLGEANFGDGFVNSLIAAEAASLGVKIELSEAQLELGILSQKAAEIAVNVTKGSLEVEKQRIRAQAYTAELSRQVGLGNGLAVARERAASAEKVSATVATLTALKNNEQLKGDTRMVKLLDQMIAKEKTQVANAQRITEERRRQVSLLENQSKINQLEKEVNIVKDVGSLLISEEEARVRIAELAAIAAGEDAASAGQLEKINIALENYKEGLFSVTEAFKSGLSQIFGTLVEGGDLTQTFSNLGKQWAKGIFDSMLEGKLGFDEEFKLNIGDLVSFAQNAFSGLFTDDAANLDGVAKGLGSGLSSVGDDISQNLLDGLGLKGGGFDEIFGPNSCNNLCPEGLGGLGETVGSAVGDQLPDFLTNNSLDADDVFPSSGGSPGGEGGAGGGASGAGTFNGGVIGLAGQATGFGIGALSPTVAREAPGLFGISQNTKDGQNIAKGGAIVGGVAGLAAGAATFSALTAGITASTGAIAAIGTTVGAALAATVVGLVVVAILAIVFALIGSSLNHTPTRGTIIRSQLNDMISTDKERGLEAFRGSAAKLGGFSQQGIGDFLRPDEGRPFGVPRSPEEVQERIGKFKDGELEGDIFAPDFFVDFATERPLDNHGLGDPDPRLTGPGSGVPGLINQAHDRGFTTDEFQRNRGAAESLFGLLIETEDDVKDADFAFQAGIGVADMYSRGLEKGLTKEETYELANASFLKFAEDQGATIITLVRDLDQLRESHELLGKVGTNGISDATAEANALDTYARSAAGVLDVFEHHEDIPAGVDLGLVAIESLGEKGAHVFDDLTQAEKDFILSYTSDFTGLQHFLRAQAEEGIFIDPEKFEENLNAVIQSAQVIGPAIGEALASGDINGVMGSLFGNLGKQVKGSITAAIGGNLLENTSIATSFAPVFKLLDKLKDIDLTDQNQSDFFFNLLDDALIEGEERLLSYAPILEDLAERAGRFEEIWNRTIGPIEFFHNVLQTFESIGEKTFELIITGDAKLEDVSQLVSQDAANIADNTIIQAASGKGTPSAREAADRQKDLFVFANAAFADGKLSEAELEWLKELKRRAVEAGRAHGEKLVEGGEDLVDILESEGKRAMQEMADTFQASWESALTSGVDAAMDELRNSGDGREASLAFAEQFGDDLAESIIRNTVEAIIQAQILASPEMQFFGALLQKEITNASAEGSEGGTRITENEMINIRRIWEAMGSFASDRMAEIGPVMDMVFTDGWATFGLQSNREIEAAKDKLDTIKDKEVNLNITTSVNGEPVVVVSDQDANKDDGTKVQTAATGGTFQTGMAIVGEAGQPELVSALPGGGFNVTPLTAKQAHTFMNGTMVEGLQSLDGYASGGSVDLSASRAFRFSSLGTNFAAGDSGNRFAPWRRGETPDEVIRPIQGDPDDIKRPQIDINGDNNKRTDVRNPDKDKDVDTGPEIKAKGKLIADQNFASLFENAFSTAAEEAFGLRPGGGFKTPAEIAAEKEKKKDTDDQFKRDTPNFTPEPQADGFCARTGEVCNDDGDCPGIDMCVNHASEGPFMIDNDITGPGGSPVYVEAGTAFFNNGFDSDDKRLGYLKYPNGYFTRAPVHFMDFLAGLGTPQAATGGTFRMPPRGMGGMRVPQLAGGGMVVSSPTLVSTGGGISASPVSAGTAGSLMRAGVPGLAKGGNVTELPPVAPPSDAKTFVDTFLEQLETGTKNIFAEAIMKAFQESAVVGAADTAIQGFATRIFDITNQVLEGKLGEADAQSQIDDILGEAEAEIEKVKAAAEKLEPLLRKLKLDEALTVKADTSFLNELFSADNVESGVEGAQEALKNAIFESVVEGMIEAMLLDGPLSAAMDALNDTLSAGLKEGLETGMWDPEVFAEAGRIAQEEIGPMLEGIGEFGFNLMDALGLGPDKMEQAKSDLQGALGGAINQSFNEAKGFKGFTKNVKEALFEHVKNGLIQAFIDTAIINGAMAPMMAAITLIFTEIGNGIRTNIGLATKDILKQTSGMLAVLEKTKPLFGVINQAINEVASSLGVSRVAVQEESQNIQDATEDSCGAKCQLEARAQEMGFNATALDALGSGGFTSTIGFKSREKSTGIVEDDGGGSRGGNGGGNGGGVVTRPDPDDDKDDGSGLDDITNNLGALIERTKLIFAELGPEDAEGLVEAFGGMFEKMQEELNKGSANIEDESIAAIAALFESFGGNLVGGFDKVKELFGGDMSGLFETLEDKMGDLNEIEFDGIDDLFGQLKIALEGTDGLTDDAVASIAVLLSSMQGELSGFDELDEIADNSLSALLERLKIGMFGLSEVDADPLSQLFTQLDEALKGGMDDLDEGNLADIAKVFEGITGSLSGGFDELGTNFGSDLTVLFEKIEADLGAIDDIETKDFKTLFNGIKNALKGTDGISDQAVASLTVMVQSLKGGIEGIGELPGLADLNLQGLTKALKDGVISIDDLADLTDEAYNELTKQTTDGLASMEKSLEDGIIDIEELDGIARAAADAVKGELGSGLTEIGLLDNVGKLSVEAIKHGLDEGLFTIEQLESTGNSSVTAVATGLATGLFNIENLDTPAQTSVDGFAEILGSLAPKIDDVTTASGEGHTDVGTMATQLQKLGENADLAFGPADKTVEAMAGLAFTAKTIVDEDNLKKLGKNETGGLLFFLAEVSDASALAVTRLDTALVGLSTTANAKADALGAPPLDSSQAFATGGIIDKPTIALMGENYNREAIIPLEGPFANVRSSNDFGVINTDDIPRLGDNGAFRAPRSSGGSSNTDQALLEEIRALREEVAGLKEEINSRPIVVEMDGEVITEKVSDNLLESSRTGKTFIPGEVVR